MLNIVEITGETEQQFVTICSDDEMDVVCVSLVMNWTRLAHLHSTETCVFV